MKRHKDKHIVILNVTQHNMALVKQYLTLTTNAIEEYGTKSVVLMQCGSFYEVYAVGDGTGGYTGSPIQDVSNICDLHIATKSATVSGMPVYMAGFGLTVLDKYVRKLQEAGYTILIYDQDTQSSNTTRSQREVISPGTYFAAESGTTLTNNLLCISLTKGRNISGRHQQYIVIGVSQLDIMTGKSSVVQFQKTYYHDSSTYDDLERHVSVHAPSECIIVGNLSHNELNDIIGFIGLSHIKVHIVGNNSPGELVKREYVINASKQKYQVEALRRTFPTMSEEQIIDAIHSFDIAISAYVLLMGFAHMHNPSIIKRLSFPTFENHTNKLLLGTHSLRQLNIIDDKRYTGTLRSVASFLNNCITNMGKREFFTTIVAPLTQVEELRASYDMTEHLLKHNIWTNLRQSLSGIQDMDKFLRKLVRGVVSPPELSSFVDTLKSAKQIATTLEEDSFIASKVNTKNIIQACDSVLEQITSVIDIEIARNVGNATVESLGIIAPEQAHFLIRGISQIVDKKCIESQRAEKALEAIKTTLSKIVQTVEKRTKLTDYIKIYNTPKMPPCLVGTSRRMSLLKNAVLKANTIYKIEYKDEDGELQTIELEGASLQFENHGGSKKEMTVTCKIIRDICSQMETSRRIMIDEIIIFYRNFIDQLIDASLLVTKISQFIAWTDVAQNKAYIANKYSYVKPTIQKRKKSFFNVEGLRHPLVEHLQTRETFVTNDLFMGTKNTDGILLYGTNAVGKTCLIRSIGIAVLMAQSGLYVPASKFTFSPYRQIFTRIVGNDDIFKGLSTFAVEMSELRTILEGADNCSLVLGDELCSGTESGSARSIFMAGIEWLHSRESTFLFATHFHEINKYNELAALKRIKLMHMEVKYDQVTQTLIYDRKLKKGPGDSTYGLEVCKALSLPDDFLSRAHILRRIYTPETRNILEETSSRYNATKIKGNCELCGNKSDEVHHLVHQASAGVNGYTHAGFKNHPANLLNICEKCHDEIHRKGGEHRRVKTSKGYAVQQI